MASTKSLAKFLFRSLLVLSLLAFSGFFGWKFYQEITGEVTSAGGVDVGAVAVMEGRAERRFDRQTRWSSIRESERLYNLDAIRTTGDSRTVLQLNYVDEAGVQKQDELILGPDTYIVLDLLGSSRNIQFVGGDLSATGSEGLTVTAGETVIAAVDGAVNLEREEGGETNVSVTEGEAVVTTAAGETVVDSENSLRVDEETGIAERVEVAVNPRLPSPNALLLTYGEERLVDFVWDQYAAWTAPQIEVSSDASFNEGVEPVLRVPGNGSASLSLEPSRWFWRVVDTDTGEEGPTLLFTVDREREPTANSPADGAVIPFRGDVPQVSTQWRQAYFADSYSVELSRSSEFTNVIASAVTSSGTTLLQNLDEGTWWWRVTPRYTRALLDESARTTGGTFTLERRLGHDPPVLISPSRDYTFSALDVSGGIDFRWEANNDFTEYVTEAATDASFNNVVAVQNTLDNYVRLNWESENGKEGSYFWRVTASAIDGQPVPLSETRRFEIKPISGSIELLDPAPGEVKEVESFSSHTFVWRSDIPGTARFQLDRITDAASDERSRIIESLVNGESFTVPIPGEGSYAWQIQMIDEAGRVLVKSPEARFRLRSEFSAPVLTSPVPGSTVSFVGTTAVMLGWDPTPGAVAYKVIFRAPDGSTIGRDDRVNGIEREYALPASAVPGEYSVELSSIRNTPPGGGATESGSATYRFRVGELVRYSAAVPSYPSNGIVLDGIDVLTEGVRLGWTQDPSLGRWTVELTKDRVSRLYRTTEPFLQLDDLEAGSYTWQVQSSDGFGQDAPDSVISRFTVGEVPEPAPPVVVSPRANENRDMTGADRLVFEWLEVAEAEFYDLALYVGGSEELVLRRNGITESRFVLRDLRILDVGDYLLVLRARTEYEDAGLSLSSRATRVPFSLSLNISGDAPDILTDEVQYAD